MAIDTNTVQTFSRTNIREDLENLIYNVDPFQTPIMTRSRREKAQQRKHEWDTDIIPAQNTGNLQIEGDDVLQGADPQNDVARLANYCGISRKVISLSETLQAVRAAGGTNTMGYQLLRNIKGLKIDIEGIITNNAIGVIGSGTTATIPGGIPVYMQRNVIAAGSSTVTVATDPANVITLATGKAFAIGNLALAVGGTPSALTESDVDRMNLQVYTGSGKSIETFVVSATNKQIVSSFQGPGGTTRFVRPEGEGNTLNVAIDYYDHDFGKFEVMPDLFLAISSYCFGIRWDYLAMAFLRQFRTKPLAKTGDSDKKMVVVEYTPCVRNEHGLGLIVGTTG